MGALVEQADANGDRLTVVFFRLHPIAASGDKEADDDIAAFYRAKEELERRKGVAGRNGDTKF